MSTKAKQTRERILDISEKIILQKGFSGTSVDEIIDSAGITKGGFFYHFKGKADLAKNLMLKYLEADAAFFQRLYSRAEALTEDPLQRYLLFLKFLAEEMDKLPDVHPGCLVASFTYESQLFDRDVHALARQGILAWRTFFAERLSTVVATQKSRIEVSSQELGDMLSSIIEGGIVVSRTVGDSKVLVQQILHYRNYIRLLFAL